MMSSREAVRSSFVQAIPTHKTGTELILVRLTSLKLPAHRRHARHALWQRSHHRVLSVSGSPRRRLAGDRPPVIPVCWLLLSKAAGTNASNTDSSPIRPLFIRQKSRFPLEYLPCQGGPSGVPGKPTRLTWPNLVERRGAKLGEVEAIDAGMRRVIKQIAAKLEHVHFCYAAGPTGSTG